MAQNWLMIQCTAIFCGEVRNICRNVYLQIRVQITVDGITGKRPDNQHAGAIGQPHQGRQRGPHRVQVRGDGRCMFSNDRKAWCIDAIAENISHSPNQSGRCYEGWPLGDAIASKSVISCSLFSLDQFSQNNCVQCVFKLKRKEIGMVLGAISCSLSSLEQFSETLVWRGVCETKVNSLVLIGRKVKSIKKEKLNE